jgi:hypothetical protein
VNDIHFKKGIQKHFNIPEIILIINRSKKRYLFMFVFEVNLRDNWGRKWCHLVAIDAIYFRDPSTQYDMKAVKRELIKAFAGFHTEGKSTDHAFPIATGNWGCGAFNGDRQLKGMNVFYF